MRRSAMVFLIVIFIISPTCYATPKKTIKLYKNSHSTFDHFKIYNHVSQLLRVDSHSSKLAKLIVGKDIYRYRVYGMCKFVDNYNKKTARNHARLDCNRLIKMFKMKLKTLSDIIDVDLQPHLSGSLVFRFITDDDDIDAVYNDEEMRAYFPSRKNRIGTLKKRMQESMFKKQSVFHFDRSIGEVSLDNKVYYAFVAINCSINPINAVEIHNYDTLDSLFLNAIYQTLTGFATSPVLPDTLLTTETNLTKNVMNEFDVVLLKALYAREVEYGMDKSTAATKIADLVFENLRR